MFCIRNLSSPNARSLCAVREFAAATFNTKRKLLQRTRALKLPNHDQYDYLKEGIAEILTGMSTMLLIRHGSSLTILGL